MLKFAAITPHPPVIIPTIGTLSDLKKTAKTIESMQKIAELFAKKKIETIILISPHGPMEYQKMTLNISPTLLGNFEQFNDYKTYFSFENDLEMIDLLQQQCKSQKIPVGLVKGPMLDHGASVPLYYLTKNYNKGVKVVPVSYAYSGKEINFDFGKVIHETCNTKHETKKKNIAIIASGDLSHCLTFDAPAGFRPEGAEFDKQLIQSLDNNDIEKTLTINANLVKEAGECGYLSIVILLGAIAQLNKNRIFQKVKFKSLSYEGPFGVGYLVGYFNL